MTQNNAQWTKKIKTILVANRGEIALRVYATCREMGIKTVAVYTEEEKHFAHVREADEAHCLGQGPLSSTYLNKQLIVDTALKAKADAIHPGYGFLSENADFADLVEKSGLIFIGPPGRVMRLMGDKKGSKVKMQEVGIPVIPGYHGDRQEADYLFERAKEVGLPLLIKASAGGGGKGMRVVERMEDFQSSLESAKREAKNSFGDDRVLLERYITSPRHIEMQVMSDTHGNHLHFFERECSIQRRHQKIVEETPSVALTPELRKQISDTAVRITKSIEYRGAGTIEYILDVDGRFYFLEMNTRLQVEHPITELVTGVDLVRQQILVADGQKLPMAQADIQQRGHSIEVRLCAEDPDNDFLPSVGKILRVGRPKAPQTRFDCGYRDGDSVSINFDPMLAKLIVWGRTREEATFRMTEAINDVPFLGLKTNREYLQRVLSTQAFAEGKTFTHFIKTFAAEIEEQRARQELNQEERALLVAQLLVSERRSGTVGTSTAMRSQDLSVWDRLQGFRNL